MKGKGGREGGGEGGREGRKGGGILCYDRSQETGRIQHGVLCLLNIYIALLCSVLNMTNKESIRT